MWKFFVSLIPPRIRVSGKVTYEIVWIKNFKRASDGKQIVGETRNWSKQILLSEDQSDQEKVATFIHELLHLLSDENHLGITEKQVQGLEKAIIKMLTLNKTFAFLFHLLYNIRKKDGKQ